jgi:c(7)-type cytochrome triheme protein
MLHRFATRLARRALALVALLAAASVPAQERKWLPLDNDGVHDPTSPAVRLLQQPAEALSRLSPDTAGNKVRWVRALELGEIEPRTNIFPETKVNLLDLDNYLSIGGSMPAVKFPHRQHTLWLDCSNCHEHLFKSKAGANKLSMQKILDGEQCGQCHGAVAFPLTECNRCHSTPQHEAIAIMRARLQQAAAAEKSGSPAAPAAAVPAPSAPAKAPAAAAPEKGKPK